MERFSITVGDRVFDVESKLQKDFYAVSCGSESGLLGKNERGDWELMLPSSEAADLPAEELGAAIEEYIARNN
ncbi:hypothetical protein [Pedobacter sp. SYSU D00535]|uniref:hypothetical protein n=1 Tax=Pedobacter sp. SYSU D00535 TaxID=2810308 RepID=UPI001A95C2D8|nr:hypothetical protein [Pedobacter sp. SYSU D00535]